MPRAVSPWCCVRPRPAGRSSTIIRVSGLPDGLLNAPWRHGFPAAQLLRGPGGSLVGVATLATARDLQALAFRRGDETKRVGAHIDVGNGLLDRRHVAGDAF